MSNPHTLEIADSGIVLERCKMDRRVWDAYDTRRGKTHAGVAVETKHGYQCRIWLGVDVAFQSESLFSALAEITLACERLRPL